MWYRKIFRGRNFVWGGVACQYGRSYIYVGNADEVQKRKNLSIIDYNTIGINKQILSRI